MTKGKKTDTPTAASLFKCLNCGSASFIEQGLISYKQKVAISQGLAGLVFTNSDPEIDAVDPVIRCTDCGARVKQ
ncbi:hypothetical protein A2291_05990 [candidate division WOR-1 bacterium RIFOXYB2_FULL_42_35]|uniref:Uncharacterized protein n=1 Tax=candidate division WOR-1 bacterium RIFOXYC2_FULL_41_25 TaxID=1802586 RepID=A0A1F4TJM4_UNCSA|nr:MAG: hypothetical protein A2247_01650 [candidate division WOR-1 bacterium RIFOXYA2_FULL_41_14]OGC22275.1 MAG: hypothetical protein A2291_05990 [candidate division WOR-1 bacterium RIFOXYB2_FULL_42_35]OGC32894.1 MAG: hypothetical protein A2462_00665 [candidate division WOR-1 bacterium RIFOXYC2_FULL_41_25]